MKELPGEPHKTWECGDCPCPRTNHIAMPDGGYRCNICDPRFQAGYTPHHQGGRISDDPEGFFARWLSNVAAEIEDGTWSVESHTQSFGNPDDGVFEFTMKLKVAP